jgi:hypothetical protein
MMCWGVNLPCCSTHEQGWLCVMIQWWWCVLDADGVLGVDVGGVVVMVLVDCAFSRVCFTVVMFLYLGLCLGCVTPEACIRWLCCYELPCPSRHGLGYFYSSLGDKIKPLMIIYSGVLFLRDFYFRALRSLVVLSFPQLLSFSSVFLKPLSETLRRSSDGRIPVSWPFCADVWGRVVWGRVAWGW